MPPAENSEAQKGYDLPPIVSEAGTEASSTPAEAVPAAPEISTIPKSPKLSKSSTQLVDLHLKNFTATKPKTAVSSTTNDDNPTVADDNDLIEKEWVEKAKQIIEANREDPNIQSQEMTHFKADYMKKRYNKVIKDGE
ncbi:MAG: hypothetical protein WDN66_01340 [Candidatus Saccharibacteria bacterium]